MNHRFVGKVALVVALAASAAHARTTYILPLGDSITQGGKTDREEYTYRYPLYGKLKSAGYDFDFIGSQSQGLQTGAKWPEPFDPDHEGHYGWKTAKVCEKLPEWMPKWQAAPDIALIHLGTNDQKAQDHDVAVVQPLKEIIALLRQKNPRVVVLVGHLNFNGGNSLKIRPLVETMAQEVSTPQSPVVTVPMYEGWVEDPKKPGADTFDWAHPNPQGQEKMAARWFDAMKPYLDDRE